MQEGVLAKSLAFQFENRAIDYDFLDDRLCAELLLTTDMSTLVGHRANLMVSNLITMPGDEKSREDLFNSFWLNIRHRATSRESDQAVCASILCGIDLRPVLAAENEDKMRVFWKTSREVPLGVVWANGPRFDLDTIRWAPKSFLHPSTWAVPITKTGLIAQVMDDGLHFSSANAVYLPSIALPTMENSIIEFQGAGENPNTYAMKLTPRVENPSWGSLRPFWKHVCLLWLEMPRSIEMAYGVLVSCSGVDEHEFYNEAGEKEKCMLQARWLAQVSLFAKGGEWAAFVMSAPPEYGGEGDVLPRQTDNVVVYPSRPWEISKNREWCIF